MLGCGIGGALTSIALIDPGDLDLVVGDGLHGARKPFHFTAILGAGRRHMQREQVAQRVDRHVDLRTLLAFATVIAGALAALRRGTQRPAVDDRGGRLGLTTRRQSQHRAQVVHQRLETARRQPTLRLLVHRRPRRQVVGHPPPRRPRFHDVAQAVKHLPKGVLPLPRILPLQQQVRRHQRPFLITYIRRIRLAANAHP